MADDYTAKLATYLDGELPPDEMKAVDAHVRSCPSCAADVLGQVQLQRAVRSSGKRYTPGPAFRARMRRQIAPRPRTSVWSAWLTAATVVAVLVIASLGAAYFGQRRLQREQAFSELADLHVATLASANPVDVVSTDRHTVKPWFQGKIPFTFNLPELQDSPFTLVGGKLSYLNQSPGAELIFKVRQHQISVFIFQERALGNTCAEDAAHSSLSFNVRSWSHNGLCYFIIGDASPEDLDKLSGLIKAAG